MPKKNLHASAIIVGDTGLMVIGASGSGKTMLCLALLDHCRRYGRYARLLSDDQVFLQRAGGRLVARAPQSTAGLVELRGFRPSPIDHENVMVVDRLVHLVPPDDVPRYGEDQSETLAGCSLPCLHLPAGNTGQNVPAICAWLALAPFRTPAGG